MRQILLKIVQWFSYLLRGSPLRRVPILGRFQERVVSYLAPGEPVQAGPFRVHVDNREDVVFKELLLYGGYESFQAHLIRSLLAPGDTFIDVGAHIGIHTLSASRRVGDEGLTLAFEPDAENRRLLMRNLKENNVENVTVVGIALSDQIGQGQLYQNPNNYANLSLEDVSRSGIAVPVSMTTLDAYLEHNPADPRLIKVDVEGGEVRVLRGADETLRKYPRCSVLAELGEPMLNSFGYTAEDLLRQLDDLGGSLFIVEEKQHRLLQCSLRELLVTVKNSPVRNVLCLRDDFVDPPVLLDGSSARGEGIREFHWPSVSSKQGTP